LVNRKVNLSGDVDDKKFSNILSVMFILIYSIIIQDIISMVLLRQGRDKYLDKWNVCKSPFKKYKINLIQKRIEKKPKSIKCQNSCKVQ